MKIALKKSLCPKPMATALGSQNSVGKDAKKLLSKETEEQIQVICTKEVMYFACNSNHPEHRQIKFPQH